jgi:predicted nucleotidyltransferase
MGSDAQQLRSAPDAAKRSDGAGRVQLDHRPLVEAAQILRRHGVGAANRPVVFGSRAAGTARRYSDLDIGLAGEPLSLAQLGELHAELEESELPIRVEVINLAHTDERLRMSAVTCRSSRRYPRRDEPGRGDR